MERWMASTDLVPSNRGSVSTCVRQQGESIVDLTLVSSSAAHRIVNWRVQEDTETLSDHRLICFDVTSHTSEPAPTTSPSGGPRWSVRRLDRVLLEEAAVVASWAPLSSADAASGAEWLNEASRNICDASMPRVSSTAVRRRQAYWWQPELMQLQRACVAAKSRYKRYRRRRLRDEGEEQALYDAYRGACITFRDAITKAKREAWEEWLQLLDDDPWGKPYKWVRQKLRPAAPPLTQNLHPELRSRVISALFPSRAEWHSHAMTHRAESSEDEEEAIPPVSTVELREAVRRMGLKTTAPGLDGVPGKAVEYRGGGKRGS
ncbi:reverse transcrpitase [Danaus plexippus plexippus]|uniref:Reverse transcrpitase n=1 Tax=Danaus plexippus plexippus TaxID=278856 RepID=A0A212F3N1_DANPL|nr:reverse transcrpitase [Danaus plexippus plexippus]